MGFLSPLFLALGLGAAVPLLIHLLRRRTGVRIQFPAVRYLARAEQEHSRRLKLRNLLLMLLRVAAIVAIALAAARPVSRALGHVVGAGHAPTAVAIVLDNSLSTSVIVDGRPLLDALKAVARRVAERAAPADRVWLVTADARTRGGTAGAVGSAIARTTPLAGAGDLPRAVLSAAALVRVAGVVDPVVALVTDGQATAWPGATDIGGVRLAIYTLDGPAPANRAVTAAVARPVRWTPRGEITATVSGRPGPGAGDSTTYRIVLGGRTLARGAVAVVPPDSGTGPGGGGGPISLHAAPPERGWIGGSVELEPDELRGDDARYVAFRIGEPPVAAVDSSAGAFLRTAAEALVANARVSLGAARPPARTIQIVAAERLTALPALIVPPSDPVRLGAANRALERAGVPWRYGPAARGDVIVEGLVAGAATASRPDSASTAGAPVTALLRYPLQPQPGAVADTLARTGAAPWVVAGPDYVLLASPVDPAATTWPLRAGFVPWLGDMLGQRLSGTAASGASAAVVAAAPGATIRRPTGVEELEAPDGSSRVLAGATIEAPSVPGVYFFRRGGARVGALTVNPEARESDLARLGTRALAARFRARAVGVYTDPDGWEAAVFDARAARPLTGFFLALALALLLAESVVTRTRARGDGAASVSVRRAA